MTNPGPYSFPETWRLDDNPDGRRLSVLVPQNTLNDSRASTLDDGSGTVVVPPDLFELAIPAYLTLIATSGKRACLKTVLVEGGDYDELRVHPLYRQRLGANVTAAPASVWNYRRHRLFATGSGRLALAAFALSLLAAWISAALAIGKAQPEPTWSMSSGWLVGWNFVAGGAALIAAVLIFARAWLTSDDADG